MPNWHWISPLPCVMCLFNLAVRYFFFLLWNGDLVTYWVCAGFWKGIGQNQGRQGLAHDLLKQNPSGGLWLFQFCSETELINQFIWIDLQTVLNSFWLLDNFISLTIDLTGHICISKYIMACLIKKGIVYNNMRSCPYFYKPSAETWVQHIRTKQTQCFRGSGDFRMVKTL